MRKQCNKCDFEHSESDKKTLSVPFVVHESMMTRNEISFRRMWILILLLVILLVGTNASWLYYESQFDVVETTKITQDNADGYNNYIGNDGDIDNGKADDYED